MCVETIIFARRYTYPAWRYRDRFGRSTISQPMQSVGAAQKIEARNVAAIAVAVGAFGKQLRTDHPHTSFGVAVIIGRGERKPNGFNAAQLGNGFGQDDWLEERDRDGNPLPAAAPEDLSAAAA